PFDPNTGYQLRSSDYEQDTTLAGVTPDGVRYEQPVYRIKQSVLEGLGLCAPDDSGQLVCQPPAGSYFVNRQEFTETYNGIEVALIKRLSDRWMARASFSYSRNVQNLEGPSACVDPTGCFDNGVVAPQSLGSGKRSGVFLNSAWQFNVSGLYLLPFDATFAANFFGRQGYPINWFRISSESQTDGLKRSVQVDPTSASRYRDVFELDLRLEKDIRIGTMGTLALFADVFNATNQNTVLQRMNQLDKARTNSILEIQSPRIWRFGARIAF